MLTSTLIFTSAHAGDLTPAGAKTIAEEAYIFGYPLATMEMTRRIMTNVTEVKGIRDLEDTGHPADKVNGEVLTDNFSLYVTQEIVLLKRGKLFPETKQ